MTTLEAIAELDGLLGLASLMWIQAAPGSDDRRDYSQKINAMLDRRIALMARRDSETSQ